jgi:chromosome segregation ATPase
MMVCTDCALWPLIAQISIKVQPARASQVTAVSRRSRSRLSMSRALGGLEASVKHITTQIEKESEIAAHHRQGLREVIGSLTEAMRVSTERQSAQTEKIAEIESTVQGLDQRLDALEAKGDQAAGAIWAFRAIWAGAGGGILAGLVWLGKKLGVI